MTFRLGPGCGCCCNCSLCSGTCSAYPMQVPAPNNGTCSDCADIAGTYIMPFVAEGGAPNKCTWELSYGSQSCFNGDVIVRWTWEDGTGADTYDFVMSGGTVDMFFDENDATISPDDLGDPYDCTDTRTITLDIAIELIEAVSTNVQCTWPVSSVFTLN